MRSLTFPKGNLPIDVPPVERTVSRTAIAVVEDQPALWRRISYCNRSRSRRFRSANRAAELANTRAPLRINSKILRFIQNESAGCAIRVITKMSIPAKSKPTRSRSFSLFTVPPSPDYVRVAAAVNWSI
jgi:hypothetical protein